MSKPSDTAAGGVNPPPQSTGVPVEPLPADPAAHYVEGTRALWAAIVESSDDAIVSKTLDGIITSWNPAAERLFGFTADEAIGKPIALVIPHDRLQEEEILLGRLRAGERIDHFETVRRNKLGELLEVLLTVSPIRTADGRIVGASKTVRRLRPSRPAETGVEETRRANDEVLTILPHELRNPLSPLLGAAALLLRNPTEQQVHWAGQLIYRQVRHMARLIDDLLDVSRIRAGKVALRKGPVELTGVLNSAIEMSRPLIDSRRHHLEVSLPTEPVFLEGDPDRLCQIFANLLNNAAKYTDEGGRICLAVEMQEHTIVVRVRDNGIGISPEAQSSIFDLFTQASHGRSGSRGGLGIGLSIARKFAEMHDGALSVRSEGQGHGTEFIVRLPALSNQSAVPGVPSVAEPRPRALSPRRVLVVDDNRDAADTLAALLRHAGHDVETAYDGVEALANALTFRPDVALLDLGLPILDGYGLAQRLRENFGSSIELIAVTGWSDPGEGGLTRDAGFVHNLVKPVDVDALLEILSSS
jgi:two-component system, chemotaxis family, CheB/CheR fusion protein